MNLSALPDQRAAENPSGPAVADDDTDLNNARFPGRCPARRRDPATPRGISRRRSSDHVAQYRRASSFHCSRHGDSAPPSRRSTPRYDRRR